MIHIYGIPNCNSVKKALDWLKAKDASFTFHDFKKEGVSEARLQAWSNSLGRENLLNKKGTTWRALTPEEQAACDNEKSALSIMRARTSIIKRPVVEWPQGTITAGFDENVFLTSFS